MRVYKNISMSSCFSSVCDPVAKINRGKNKILRAREKDAAELRSLLEQKRGVSAQLARGAEAARARAERAEKTAEELRVKAASLR